MTSNPALHEANHRTRAYEEIIDFIASGAGPQAIAAFEASPAAEERIEQLVGKSKDGTLDADESAELNHFMALEHIMRLAKARARARLA